MREKYRGALWQPRVNIYKYSEISRNIQKYPATHFRKRHDENFNIGRTCRLPWMFVHILKWTFSSLWTLTHSIWRRGNRATWAGIYTCVTFHAAFHQVSGEALWSFPLIAETGTYDKCIFDRRHLVFPAIRRHFFIVHLSSTTSKSINAVKQW